MGTQKNPKHMFKLIGKEINAVIGAQTILVWTYDFFDFRVDRSAKSVNLH